MENKEEKEKRKIEIDITNMILETYNTIAIWNNNDDYKTPKQKEIALKVICNDIVQSIIDKTVQGMSGVKTTLEVSRGDMKVSDLENANSGKDVFNELFMKK